MQLKGRLLTQFQWMCQFTVILYSREHIQYTVCIVGAVSQRFGRPQMNESRTRSRRRSKGHEGKTEDNSGLKWIFIGSKVISLPFVIPLIGLQLKRCCSSRSVLKIVCLCVSVREKSSRSVFGFPSHTDHGHQNTHCTSYHVCTYIHFLAPSFFQHHTGDWVSSLSVCLYQCVSACYEWTSSLCTICVYLAHWM